MRHVSINAIAGSCLCGAAAFEVNPPIAKFVHCHCSRCRKASGAAFSTNVYVAPHQLVWHSRADVVERFDLPTARSFAKCFCRYCGCPLPRLTGSGKTIVIPAGSLDQDYAERPSAHIFWDSRASWLVIEDGLPRYAEYPDWW
jgi:hypothetical protein